MRNETGASLIETLVALALLGIAAAVFLNGLSMMFNGSMVAQERVVADSLAKSQWEYIKAQDYIATDNYSAPANSYQLIDIPSDLAERGYEIEIVPPQIVISPGTDENYECQSLTIIIERNDSESLRISGYKAGTT